MYTEKNDVLKIAMRVLVMEIIGQTGKVRVLNVENNKNCYFLY